MNGVVAVYQSNTPIIIGESEPRNGFWLYFAGVICWEKYANMFHPETNSDNNKRYMFCKNLKISKIFLEKYFISLYLETTN